MSAFTKLTRLSVLFNACKAKVSFSEVALLTLLLSAIVNHQVFITYKEGVSIIKKVNY